METVPLINPLITGKHSAQKLGSILDAIPHAGVRKGLCDRGAQCTPNYFGGKLESADSEDREVQAADTELRASLEAHLGRALLICPVSRDTSSHTEVYFGRFAPGRARRRLGSEPDLFFMWAVAIHCSTAATSSLAVQSSALASVSSIASVG